MLKGIRFKLILFIASGVLLVSCSDTDHKKTIYSSESFDSVSAGEMNKSQPDSIHPSQSRFIAEKIQLHRELLKNNSDIDTLKNQQKKLSNAFLKECNFELTNWYGQIMRVGVLSDFDLMIKIESKQVFEELGLTDQDQNSKVQFIAIQHSSEKIARWKSILASMISTENKNIKIMKKGDEIHFNARVQSISDIYNAKNELLVVLHVKISDIW
jgi:hypothetical protein